MSQADAIPLGGLGPVVPAAGAARRPLRQRVIRGSAWTLGAFGASQMIRLGSNVVLASLLTPAVLGVMYIVNLLLQGLQMFSDVGIGPSIVQNPRGEEPRFLHTAWTIQVMRGFVLWGVGAAMAFPLAWICDEPSLVWLVPVASGAAAAMGFNSTSLFTLNRHLLVGRLSLLDLAVQSVTTVVLIAWAAVTRDAWALVGGTVVGAILRAMASHAINPHARDRFAWHRPAAAELLRFGRWIFLSTAITFLAERAYGFVAANAMPTMTETGIFAVALLFPMAVHQGVSKLTQSIIFPVYSQMAREPDRNLRSALVKVQAATLALTVPVLVAMVIGGPAIIRLLYQPAYWDAGWMLQVLAAGQLVATINAPTVPVLLARGDSFRHMVVLASKAVVLLATMGLGFRLGGIPGLIVGIAAANLVNYPVVVWAVRRYNAWVPWLDAAAFAGAGAIIAAGLWLTGQAP